MKKLIILSLLFAFLSALTIIGVPLTVQAAATLAQRLEGKILLNPQDHGKTYYVFGGNRYRITTDTVLKIFEKLSLGVGTELINQLPERYVQGMGPESFDQPVVEATTTPEIVERIVYINQCATTTDGTVTLPYSEPEAPVVPTTTPEVLGSQPPADLSSWTVNDWYADALAGKSGVWPNGIKYTVANGLIYNPTDNNTYGLAITTGAIENIPVDWLVQKGYVPDTVYNRPIYKGTVPDWKDGLRIGKIYSCETQIKAYATSKNELSIKSANDCRAFIAMTAQEQRDYNKEYNTKYGRFYYGGNYFIQNAGTEDAKKIYTDPITDPEW